MHVSFCFWSILFCFIKHISYLQSRISVVCVWTHPSCSQKATIASKSRMGALSCSFSDPRFSWIQTMLCVRHNECVPITAQNMKTSRLDVVPNLFACDFFADEEVELVSIFGWVVYSAGRWQSVTSSSSWLLIVTGQRFCQIPVNDKPENIQTLIHNIKHSKTQMRTMLVWYVYRFINPLVLFGLFWPKN